MRESPFSSPLEDTVVIVGVGLIGGSLAAALKRRNAVRRVIGVGRDATRIQAARDFGLIDEADTHVDAVADQANLIVFCTPVDFVVDGVRAANAAIAERSAATSSSNDCLITDAGSVKAPICDQLSNVSRFIGSHPIAGSHRQGFEAADPRLFEDRICVLTPGPACDEPQVQRLERFWNSVGMKTVRMSPAAHDRSLAMTSHLPHVVASALATTLSEENRILAGTGFRDTTRIAAGDPELWTGILLQNAGPVREGLDELQRNLAAFSAALSAADGSSIRSLLQNGQLRRSSLGEIRRGPD